MNGATGNLKNYEERIIRDKRGLITKIIEE